MLLVVRSPWIMPAPWSLPAYPPIRVNSIRLSSSVNLSTASLTFTPSMYSMTMTALSGSTWYSSGVGTPLSLALWMMSASAFVLLLLSRLSSSGCL